MCSTPQAQITINAWLWWHNQVRSHHALETRTPVPEILLRKPKFIVPGK
jgi:hypothetical protein